MTDDHDLLKHEAMDRIHVLSENLSIHLMDHPFVLQRPAVLEPLQAAFVLLSQAYQAVEASPAEDLELARG